MRHRVLTACAVSFASAAAILACVGSDPTVTATDDRGDASPANPDPVTQTPNPATTSDAAPNDGAAVDSGASCDPAKPFNAASTVNLTGLNVVTEDIPMQDQFSPRLSADELTIYYGQYPGSTGTDVAPAADVFSATRSSVADPFPPGSALSDISTSHLEEDFSVSSNGLTAFYTTNRLNTSSCASATGICIAKVSRPTVTAGFSGAALFINNPGEQRYPYAVGTKPNVYYAARSSTTQSWDITSDNPGATFNGVNGPGVDTSPVITPDELVLYFASDRDSDGGTNLDIYVAKRAKNTDPFGTPTRVAGLSTDADELPGYVSADGCRLYLTRDDGSSGGLNLYSASK